MPLFGLTLLVLVGHLVHGYSPGIDFVGIGYNLLSANPEGGVGSAGGVDPGLKGVRKILQLSPGSVPKEVVYKSRHSCLQQKSTHVYYGTKSYQSRLGFGLKSSGQGNDGVLGAAFSLSAGYKKASSETNTNGNVMYDDETICNLGTARFAEELSSTHNFHVTFNFVAAVCRLPLTYNTAVYMKFLDDWGTHVVMGVDFGTKVIKRYVYVRIYKARAEKCKWGGFGLKLGGFLSVDFHTFKASSAYKLQFGTYQTTLTAGTTSDPEPIGLTIKTIAEALNHDYWYGSDIVKACGHPLSSFGHVPPDWVTKQNNLVKALNGYAKFKLFKPPTDPQLQIPLTWPSGTYGFIKANTGCPKGRVPWHMGSRHQDDYSFLQRNHQWKERKNNNAVSNPHHMSIVVNNDITLGFCIKGEAKFTEFDGDWPAGDYCVLKYGDCPKGFQTGSILWDDTNKKNKDSSSGLLPDGKYDADTRIDFCCREDGVPEHKILLPTEAPFYLMRYKRPCQQVYGMSVAEEYIVWENEHLHNHDQVIGAHPYDDGGGNYHKLHFCYYSKSGTSLIG